MTVNLFEFWEEQVLIHREVGELPQGHAHVKFDMPFLHYCWFCRHDLCGREIRERGPVLSHSSVNWLAFSFTGKQTRVVLTYRGRKRVPDRSVHEVLFQQAGPDWYRNLEDLD